ncbi:MAG: NRAMP family divalent metal transporter [Chthoniobacterales bacterium]
MKPAQIVQVALGIVTSIGGFLEAGSIATAAQAGAAFGFQLLWPIALGTICLIFLIEMSGRLAAVSHHPLPAAVRERFGFHFFAVPLFAETAIDFLVLSSEIGGVCLGLQLLTGIRFFYWTLPVALFIWLLLWRATFGIIEYGVSTLGLITLVLVVAAITTHPPVGALTRGFVPSLPAHDRAQYWFFAVSIIGATISPYLLNFYSSGAVEDKWTEKDLVPNRITAALGMSFGGMISMAVLVAAAMVLHPRGIRVESYEQVPLIVTQTLGQWGYRIFGCALIIACLGAALELSLDMAYVYAQGFGWKWGENIRPAEATRFALTYTIFIFAASVPIALGADPLKVTIFSMAITTLILPVITFPLLVVMNDKKYLRNHTNSRFSNFVVSFVVLLAALIAVVAIPLQIFGGQ